MMPRLNLQTYNVTRYTLVAPVNGRKQPSTTSTVTIVANVQPMGGRDLKMIPEARWTEDIRKVYTTTPLFTGDSTYDADQINIGGSMFEVFRAAPWTGFGGHFECFASKVVRQ